MGLLTLTTPHGPAGARVVYRCARCKAVGLLYANEDGDLECLCGHVYYRPSRAYYRKDLPTESHPRPEYEQRGIDWADRRAS